ncbi:uncharacterized protein LOC110809301 isoform X2 [Carica papaya]|nr:uncharacterized protein LOC110809301 isoform X2 [Carica papaya]
MRSKNEGAVDANKDDWVEVEPPVLDLRSSPLPSSFDGDHPGGSIQDFYEATAEINDADPCISITLRLLSLQDKGCLFLDEVYVFADPVDPADPENQAGQVENMAGSSVMAMLVPTLLQLSKTRDVKRIQDKQASDMIENQKTADSGLKATKSKQVADKMCEGKSRMAAADQLEENIQEAVVSTAKTPQVETSQQLSGAESKPELSCSHADSLLGQLVSRVSRIEDLFLRFEEHMLKPISNINERLQHVEQTLEKLVEKFQSSELPSCTRIIAPEFSCHESDHNSSYSNENNDSNCGSSEVNKEEASLSVTLNDMVNSTSVGQSVPGLVVTAPEFANIDDEEDYSSPRNSQKDEAKCSVSIDDALASALSGFLSSTLIERQRCTEALAPEVNDFSNEEVNDNNEKAPPNRQCGESTDPLSCSGALEGTDCIKVSPNNSSCISCIEGEGNVMRSLDYFSKRTMDGIPEQCQHKVSAEDAFECIIADCKVAPAGYGLENDNYNQLRENTGPGEPDIQSQCLGDLIDNNSNSTQGRVASSEFSTTRKELKECYNDILQDVLKFSHGTCLDFEMPILDVKFNSLGNLNGRTSIAALFNELPESNDEAPAVRENVDALDRCNLISVGDEGLTGPPTDTLFMLI